MATTAATFTLPDEDPRLTRANKTITNLREDIRKLSDELKSKSEQLTSILDVAHEQSLCIASLKAALQDTAPWDPDTSHRPSSSSTPRQNPLWTEVVTRGRKRISDSAAPPPRLSLSNRFETLSLLGEAPVAGCNPCGSADAAAPSSSADGASAANGVSAAPRPSGPTSSSPTSDGVVDRPQSGPSSASRRLLLKQAVLRNSRGRPCPGEVRDSEPPVDPSGTLLLPSCGAPDLGARRPQPPPPVDGTTNPPSSRRNIPDRDCKQPSPPPLPSEPSSPVTLVIGDSIVKHIKSKTSATYCFPGAKVLDMVKRIPALLSDHPRARNVVIHVGTNNTADCESEILKQDFISLFNLLRDCGKSVFISGPLPSLHRGVGRFSRLLSLNTWLQSACSSHNVLLIDNFNLFWNRGPFFSRDGIHPSPHGSRALAANIFHAVTTNSRNNQA